MTDQKFDAAGFLEDLGAGTFAGKVAGAIKRAAIGERNFGRSKHHGQIVITLDLTKMGDSAQVMVEHSVKYREPTARGHVSETDTTETPMYVNADGSVTVFPDAQGKLFGDAEREEA